MLGLSPARIVSVPIAPINGRRDKSNGSPTNFRNDRFRHDGRQIVPRHC